jgi:hypothetical protein
MPVFMLFLLCFIQLVMVMHAKFLADYAVFCAARAGVVHRGDPDYMKQAAAVALAPLYRRTTDYASLGAGYTLALADIGDEGDLLRNARLYLQDSSKISRYNSVSSYGELSQDERVLHVTLEYDYPMDIPLANKILYELMSGVLGGGTTVSGGWMYAGTAPAKPEVPIVSVCSMRVTTLTTPS